MTDPGSSLHFLGSSVLSEQKAYFGGAVFVTQSALLKARDLTVRGSEAYHGVIYL